MLQSICGPQYGPYIKSVTKDTILDEKEAFVGGEFGIYGIFLL